MILSNQDSLELHYLFLCYPLLLLVMVSDQREYHHQYHEVDGHLGHCPGVHESGYEGAAQEHDDHHLGHGQHERELHQQQGGGVAQPECRGVATGVQGLAHHCQRAGQHADQ